VLQKILERVYRIYGRQSGDREVAASWIDPWTSGKGTRAVMAAMAAHSKKRVRQSNSPER
jgi:hypothetical protein